MPGAVPVPLIRALAALRRARRFGCVARLSEAQIHGGRYSSAIWRAYAQALIEQDLLVAAEHVLREAVARTPPGTPEAFELQGLIGRVLKQWYLRTAAGAARGPRRTESTWWRSSSADVATGSTCLSIVTAPRWPARSWRALAVN